MLAKIIAVPFMVVALVFLYLAMEVDGTYGFYTLFPVMALSVIYVFSPQINWWWYQRNPPELKAPVRQLLNARFPFYQSLSAANKKRFRVRMTLYMEANDFIAQGTENIPQDVKSVIAANAVWLTFGLADFLLNPFEHIVVYPHPFPSPQFPKNWHTAEIQEEDGVILFAVEQLMKGFWQPRKFYNIGLHEFAKVFVKRYPDKNYPQMGPDCWEKLKQVSGFSYEFISKWIGLPDIEPLPVAIAHFFVFPENFQRELPEEFEAFRSVFNQNLGLRQGD